MSDIASHHILLAVGFGFWEIVILLGFPVWVWLIAHIVYREQPGIARALWLGAALLVTPLGAIPFAVVRLIVRMRHSHLGPAVTMADSRKIAVWCSLTTMMYVAAVGTWLNVRGSGPGFEGGNGWPFMWYRWTDYSEPTYHWWALEVNVAIFVFVALCVGLAVGIG